MYLDTATFATVIDSTPLVSIDLIVKNAEGEVLVGERVNRPAQGYLFVPGGRILKNERLSTAFRRLTKEELGFEISINDAKLLGPYDHLYSDSVLGSHISTHYVAIAYQVTVANLINLPKQQHSAYQWLSIEELILSADVHENTKAYFTSRR